MANPFFSISRKVDRVKCLHTKDPIFNWKSNLPPGGCMTLPLPSGSASSVSSSISASSVLRGDSPPSQLSPASRSRSPRSPPGTPRSRRALTPRTARMLSPSPDRDQPPAGSPRASRIDTPTRANRRAQRSHGCRNQGCHESFSTWRLRHNHEINRCNFRPHSQVYI